MRGLSLLMGCALLCGCGESFNKDFEAGPVFLKCEKTGEQALSDNVRYYRVDKAANTMRFLYDQTRVWYDYNTISSFTVDDQSITYHGEFSDEPSEERIVVISRTTGSVIDNKIMQPIAGEGSWDGICEPVAEPDINGSKF